MSSHRDAHPYGRSGDDLRKRNLREARLRRLRITQLVVFSLLVILLAGAVAYALQQLRTPAEPPAASPSSAAAPASCPSPGALPAPPGEVTVTVLNGTDRSGLAGQVTEELAGRGYATGEAGNTDQAQAPATVVHGEGGYLAAASVAAQVEGAVVRSGDVPAGQVQLLIGEGWPGLRPADAATAALAQPAPAPEGCG